ncbi:hypothetical protein CBOM_03248 [Ceraceosorus bombacis]|uniref:Uncharacterized protein n=1 Tax=Ceraceosorus bombacis TaxID=401625 RepID=A0A0P1BM59_9BASI|nr:hypothetical protein CBOM_03248 [Ceraceosorus bombacis]
MVTALQEVGNGIEPTTTVPPSTNSKMQCDALASHGRWRFLGSIFNLGADDVKSGKGSRSRVVQSNTQTRALECATVASQGFRLGADT